MKTHLVEWKRLVRQGRTCDRCENTGATLRQVVRGLNTDCAKARVRFLLKTTRLPGARLAESNTILIDGQPLERLVPRLRAVETDCPSCVELTGNPSKCRALEVNGRTRESVPAELIRAAFCRVADCCQFEFDRRGGVAGCEPRQKSRCAECG